MVSIQHVNGLTDGQASRLKRPPGGLRRLVELANCLPPGQELPDLPDFWKVQGESLAGANTGAQAPYLNQWRNILERLPSPLRDYVGTINSGRWSEVNEVYGKYVYVRELRKTLRAIAERKALAELRYAASLSI